MYTRQHRFLVMLMFLIGLLAPTGWLAALATATEPAPANQSEGQADLLET